MAQMMTGKKQNLLYALLLSVMVVILTRIGVWKQADAWVQDMLFQQPRYTDGEVVVFGIDEKALGSDTSYRTKNREMMAQALEILSADPSKKPAVVAIDTLYVGEGTLQEDAHLAFAAEKLGNVITAGAAVFDSGWFEKEEGEFVWDDYHIVQYEEPYEALRDVTAQGHINAMYDEDGYMRHALWYIEPGERVYSMPYLAAQSYAKERGETLEMPKVNGKGQFYITFSGRPGTYYDGSFADLIAGEIPADTYAGKIVLIGPYAAGLQDSYVTSIDRAQAMYGVEIQANIIQQMLSGNYKAEVPDGIQLAVLFLTCFIVAFLLFRWKLAPASLLCGGLGVLSLVLGYWSYSAGRIWHLLWIPAGILILYVVSLGLYYLRAAAQKKQITKTFERYVAPQIVREILKEDPGKLSLGGKMCDIAVLFVDVRGFTSMSERLEPEKVVYILNRYLSMASGCVEEYQGTLDKFVGDAMMAFWGAPLAQEDIVYRAVRAAQAIVEGAERISRELKDEIGEELAVGVGVHFGPAVVGNMGAERHMDYTAIGDTVNTAARLEANAPGGEVYISRAVADALAGRIEAESLGNSIKLKGKQDGFEILRLKK